MKTLQKASHGAGFHTVAPTMPEKSTSDIVVETLDSSLVVSERDNLLDALLASGHEIDYQCRGGYCGACRVKVSSGHVAYDEYPLAHMDSDEILPCCCRVTEPLKIAVPLREVDNTRQTSLFDSEDSGSETPLAE